MALYDPVNGVYRKVVKKYDPVDGVYRNVTKAYDPVDGVYREYFSSGVPWMKYNCTKKTNTTGSYFLGAQKTLSQGWDNEKYFQGSSNYIWNRNSGTVYASGEQSFVDKDHPGVVYEDDGTGNTIYGYSVRGDGFWHTFSKTVGYETETTITYTRNGLVGTVYAPEGEYPDVKKGYTYVTIYDGYTIMQDPDTGDYYAYLLEEE